jgi:hypothetical protein
MVLHAIGSFGGIAQLGEHLICIQGVVGSNPSTSTIRAVSSVGRASRLHRGGQRFESFTAHQSRSISVAVNTSPCHGEDHGFESRMLRQPVPVVQSDRIRVS